MQPLQANASVFNDEMIVDWFKIHNDDLKEVEAVVNLGFLSLFVQRGPCTGITYQPKVNHHHLDIGNYTKKDKKHSFSLIDTALGRNGYGFDRQSLIKIIPYKMKKEFKWEKTSMQFAVFLCCNWICGRFILYKLFDSV